MPTLKRLTPIFRSFDATKAKEFYVGFLDFTVEFEHRFGENYPLYMGLSRDGVFLHLSEHHGDACPGGNIRIETDDVRALCRTLQAKDYQYAKPGDPQEQPWGNLELTVTDPFGNKLTFWQAL